MKVNLADYNFFLAKSVFFRVFWQIITFFNAGAIDLFLKFADKTKKRKPETI